LSTFLLEGKKKRAFQEGMETFSVPLQIVLVITVLGALVETYMPGILTERFKTDASALTMGLLGIVFSTLALMVFLRGFVREGFEDKPYLTRWTSIVNTNQIQEVCALYTEMYGKIMTVEKGAPPEPVKTDAQAREATDKLFADVMNTPPLSCSLFEEVDSKKESLDELYKSIQKLPDIFLVQVYETALACRTLLIRQVLDVKRAEQERKEGFENGMLCSDAAAQEKREFNQRKALSDEAQQCLLIEEIPMERKLTAVLQKLTKIQETYDRYKKSSKETDSYTKILDDAKAYKAELDKKKQEAEDLSNKYNF
jgi:hypothetical protein